jgi:hypothetical protein
LELTLPPSAAESEPALDARTPLFRQGLAIVRELTGKSDPGARALLGKMLAGVRDDCPRLMHILQQCRDARPANPIPWLMTATGFRQDGLRETVEERRRRELGIGTRSSTAAAPTLQHLPDRPRSTCCERPR